MTHPTIPQHLRNVAQVRTRDLALIDAWGMSTFGELGEQIDRTAQALLDRGMVPGDRIGLALQPSTPYVALVLGALAAGLVPTPLNTRLTAVETHRFVEPLEVTMVIADAHHEAFAAALELPLVMMGATELALPLRERLAPLDADALSVLPTIDRDAPALILPTGGTSGAPKGVWFDHSALWRSVCNAALNRPRKSNDRDLYFAPFFHIMFPAQLLYTLFMGGSTEILTEFDAGQALDALARGSTRLGGAPTLMSRLRQHPSFETTPRDHVSQVLFGAAPASTSFISELLGDYPNASVHALYGATEYGGTVCSIPHEDLIGGHLEGVGRPWPGQHVCIITEDGLPCAPGETGYFSVRAIGEANGYWGRPDETAQVFRPEGIRVGDMGWYDDTGRFFIVGRDSEMIITGGENVFPSEVEPVLSEHPAVADVLVFGAPDQDWGHRVEALVVRGRGHEVTFDDLREFARDRLAGYKRPKAIHFVDAIPVTPNNKPDRTAALRLAVDRRADGGGNRAP